MNHHHTVKKPATTAISRPASTASSDRDERPVKNEITPKLPLIKKRARTADLLALNRSARHETKLPTAGLIQTSLGLVGEVKPSSGTEDETAEITLILSMPFKASLSNTATGHLDIRADFRSIGWIDIAPIAQEMRWMIAQRLGVTREEVKYCEGISFSDTEGIARGVFCTHSRHHATMNGADFRQMVLAFFKAIKTGNSQKGCANPETADHAPTETEDLFKEKPLGNAGRALQPADTVDVVDSAETATLVAKYANAVLQQIGGRTLPGQLVIEAPEWPTGISVDGRLAAKPAGDENVRAVLLDECEVDGFAKSKRLVHLMQRHGGAHTDVSFDEQKWLPTIIGFASREDAKLKAIYRETTVGLKVVSRELIDLVELLVMGLMPE